MTGPFPPSAFWDFSLRLYVRPGVADACLRLQARHGIDVNLLFCCLWRGTEGERLTGPGVEALMAHVQGLHQQVVKPLRAVRTALKTMLDGDPALAAALGQLRAAVKKSELDAEHIEQLLLAGMFEERPGVGGAADPSAAALANAESYCAVLGLSLSGADRVDLAFLVESLETAKIQSSHPVDSALRRAEERGRRRPLARDRGGA